MTYQLDEMPYYQLKGVFAYPPETSTPFRGDMQKPPITTNLVFSAWDRIFKDPMTTLAAVDRVVHHSVILDMSGVESFRATQAQQEHTREKVGQASSSPTG